tara:strand:+ start:1220 stop:1855 length:636 start_codon:yes stop_codon:yes gene_type:complete
MEANKIYNNYINIIYSEIINQEQLDNIKIENETDMLKNIFYNSKYIEFKELYEIYDTSKQIIKYIGLYKIQKLFFILIIPVNILKKEFYDQIIIFKTIIQKNKIFLFDNKINFFSKYFKKEEYNQIEQQISGEDIQNDINKIKTIDDSNIEIIMNQTNYKIETAKKLYYENNKNIEKVIEIYLDCKKINKNENMSTNQQIFKELRNFLNNT